MTSFFPTGPQSQCFTKFPVNFPGRLSKEKKKKAWCTSYSYLFLSV